MDSPPPVDATPPPDATTEERRFGEMLVAQGMITAEQLATCLAVMAESARAGGIVPRLGEVLIGRGYLTAHPAPAAAGLETVAEPPGAAGKDAMTRPPAGGGSGGGTAVEPTEVVAARREPANLFGKYVITAPLGRGGMGTVYKAWDQDLCRFVALKWLTAEFGAAHTAAVATPRAGGLRPALTPRGEAEERFLREARTAAQLSHPNIVQVHEVGVAEGRPFLALEYVEGGSFRDFLMREGVGGELPGGRLAPAGPRVADHAAPAPHPAAGSMRSAMRRAVRLLRDVALALEHAHQHGILHRDIKPENILLARADAGGGSGAAAGAGTARARGPNDTAIAPGAPVWVPKLADFGLARDLTSSAQLTKDGEALGTPAYMSPEQADGRVGELGPASDLFALGVVLYEAVTGVRPFGGESTASILYAIIEREPRRPRVVNPEVPADLETIVLTCLEKAWARRYPSAGALARDLDAWLEGEPIAARPPTWIYVVYRRLRRQPAAAAATLVAVLALATLGISAARAQLERAREERTARARAESALLAQDWREAARHFERLLEIAPADAAAGAALARCRAAAAEEEKRRVAADAAAQELARAADRRNAAHPVFLRGFMEARDAEGDRRAIEAFGEALRIFPEYAEALAERGRRRLRLGGLDAALADFAAARRLAPTYYVAAYYAGLIYMDHRKDFAAARRELAALLDLEPARDYYWAARARLALLEKDFAGALRACDEAVKTADAIEDVHLIRGIVLSEEGFAGRDY
ncbi:MAG: serine/threonine protein kinase, partial [Planctomycetes bacterium]|nr:serine/threonine protein kinase [Planctomycetota bacterium]